MPEGHTWTVKKILITVLLFVLLAGVWQCINSPLVTVVTGTGEVSVPATNATVSFSVSSTDSSIQNAVANVNAKALVARELLKSKGVAEANIAQGQVVTAPGFTATIVMAVKTTAVSDISTLVTELYKNGASAVSQPILSVENQEKLEDEAFKMAMSDAKSKATKIGTRNWKFIRKLVGVAQSESNNTSTATTISSSSSDSGNFKIIKTVSTTYKMW